MAGSPSRAAKVEAGGAGGGEKSFESALLPQFSVIVKSAGHAVAKDGAVDYFLVVMLAGRR